MSVSGVNAQERERFQEPEIRALEKAIRRIVRAHDLQSRALFRACGLTAAQLAIMRGIDELGEVTSVALSVHADISAATVVTVLDNLEERGLIDRYRSGSDRRIVHTRLTERGRAILAGAPSPLGDAFLQRVSRFDAQERRRIVEAASTIADLVSRDMAPATAGPEAKPDAAGA